MDSLREDLDHLVHSPGWRHFLAHIEQEWGTRERGGGARFTLATNAAVSETAESDALAKLRQICVAQREIHNAIAWVETTLKQATKADRELVETGDLGQLTYSRRGGL